MKGNNMIEMPDYCCDKMKQELTRRFRSECPNSLIRYSDGAAIFYGLHGSTPEEPFHMITYCPWCGTNLVKHEEVFVEVRKAAIGKEMADQVFRTLETEDHLRKLTGMQPIPRTPGGLPLLPGMHKSGAAAPQQIPAEEAARLRPGYKSQALGYYLNTDTGKMEVWCEATQTWKEIP